MGHKADDWISLLQCIWGKINWIRGKWTLKQCYCSLAAHHMDTMLSLMSTGHQKPRGRQLSRDLLFQTGDRWGGWGEIFRWNIGWMHMHFVGVRWKCFRLFWDPPSDPQKRWLQYNCDQLSSLTSASKHSLLAPSPCASLLIHVIVVHCDDVCFCITLCTVYACCMLWCNMMFKGNGKCRKSWKESTNVHQQTWIVNFFFLSL